MKARDQADQFERFALRIAGDQILDYHKLVRMPLTDFLRAAEAWMERLIAAKKQAAKAKAK